MLRLEGIVEVTPGDDTLAIVQRPTRLFRALTGVACAIALLCGWMAIDKLFLEHTTRFVCVRATDRCEIEHGRDLRDLPPLHDIAGATLERHVVHKVGDMYDVALRLRDGSTRLISPEATRDDASLAEYRAAVSAIDRFAADPAATRLAVAFTYHPSIWEQTRTVLLFVGMLGVVGVMLVLWQRRTYAFDRKAGTLAVKSSTAVTRARVREVALDQITTVHPFGLRLADGGSLPLPSPAVARDVAAFLGLPVA
jgi:hypothetical protein